MALLNKVIIYILKCTVLNLNDISTKDFSEALYFINCKSVIICPLVLLSIKAFFLLKLKFVLCCLTKAIMSTGHYHDG
jgi:hypothetical protein